jgi:hypothetical protein
MKTFFLFLLGLAAFAQFALAELGDTAVTPEPGTVVLLVTGLAGMGFAVWRRNRSK